MVSFKQELHHLVDELDDERAREAVSYLRHLVSESTVTREDASTRLADRMSRLAMPGHSFFAAPTSDLATLAAQQGVKPAKHFDDLLGNSWPEDESVDEFISTIRQWRREGGRA
ncbi:MAG: hypothetical protein AB7R89_18735 [Dehalococcoidia bacterium]